MCVIYLAFDHSPDHPLILLANRDEYYDRPASKADFWTDFPDIYGGRDLVAGGTWLGVTKGGRVAAVTNYRDPSAPPGSRSRGDLVADFLKTNTTAEEYLAEIERRSNEYSGFNLLVGEFGERHELFYYSNRRSGIRQLSPGIYGLSNHFLDTPWPKVTNGKERFRDLLDNEATPNEEFFALLSDKSLAQDDQLPSTGVPFETEKALSAIFIQMPGYGTRCSTILTFDKWCNWRLEERLFI